MPIGPQGPGRLCARGGACWVAVLAMALAPMLSGGAAEAKSRNARPRFDVVVIDAGHGGDDEGALGERGLAEKELVLDVALRLKKRLRARGLEVVMTREGDVFVPLETRTSLANDARADLFVSIHANAARSTKPRGIETYFVSLEASDENAQRVAERENLAFGEAGASGAPDDPLVALLGDMMATQQIEESGEFAKIAHAELTGVGAAPPRGVKQAPFVVLMGVQMPASLIEIGFVTNATEARELRTADRRESIASALERAVERFGQRFDARRGVTSASGLAAPSRR